MHKHICFYLFENILEKVLKFHLFLVLLQIYPMPIAVECMNNAGDSKGVGQI